MSTGNKSERNQNQLNKPLYPFRQGDISTKSRLRKGARTLDDVVSGAPVLSGRVAFVDRAAPSLSSIVCRGSCSERLRRTIRKEKGARKWKHTISRWPTVGDLKAVSLCHLRRPTNGHAKAAIHLGRWTSIILPVRDGRGDGEMVSGTAPYMGTKRERGWDAMPIWAWKRRSLQ